MNKLRDVLKAWLPSVLVISALCGVIYLTIQQTLRLGGNDPQIQMAEDAAAALEAGASADSILPAGKVDIAASLAPYLIVFDANGRAVASNALLNGSIPSVPEGVLEYAREHGEDRVTFQPEQGVRSATVVRAAAGGQKGFVLAGRSLREVEKRVDLLGLQVGVGWLVTSAAALVLVTLLELIPTAQVINR